MNRMLSKLLRIPKTVLVESNIHVVLQDKELVPMREVGENWIVNKNAPVAVMLGFDPGKYTFVAEYLKNFRTLFLEPDVSIDEYADKISSYNPKCIIVWGYTEFSDVTGFASRHTLPIYRMEDGFLHSASLDTANTRAYSLVLDKSSLYFNANEQSDLEKLLLAYDFDRSPNLLLQAERLIEFQKRFGIGKYNFPSEGNAAILYGKGQRRRVLVIGQSMEDQSVLYANPEGWTCERLIQLAREENPDCEVLYKPHPEELKGLGRENSSVKESLPQCTVIEKNISLAELFPLVERVYVMTSLAGFEALLHNVPVTTTGMPFYAGWGLTDDRTKPPRPRRILTPHQLYAGACLMYPQYILDLENSARGCQKTLFRLCEEKNGVTLLGENWEDAGKPVALIYGLGAERAAKLLDILSKYRVAVYVNGEMDFNQVCKGLKPEAIFAYNKSLPYSVVQFAGRCGIELNALVKGIAVTASDAQDYFSYEIFAVVPYNQAFDTAEASPLSALESLLSSFDIEAHRERMKCMDSFLPLNRTVHKGFCNILDRHPAHEVINIKIKQQRILLLAQDAAEVLRLRSLACSDHANAELFVLVSEAVAQKEFFPEDCTLLPPRAILADILDFMDKVYTADSPLALEALRRGIPVTVTGTPFYAGWGLTDDRSEVSRPRVLTREEFFYAVFILYPCYFIDTKDSIAGFFCETLRWYGKCLLANFEQNSKSKPAFRLSDNNTVQLEKEGPATIQELKAYFGDFTSKNWLVTVACLLYGMHKKNNDKKNVVFAAKSVMDDRTFHVFLEMLATVSSANYMKWELASLYKKLSMPDLAQKMLDEIQEEAGTTSLFVKAPSATTCLNLAGLHKDDAKPKMSQRYYWQALLQGVKTSKVLEQCASNASECMDFESSLHLYRFLYELASCAGNELLALRALSELVVNNAYAGNPSDGLLWLTILGGMNINVAMRTVDATQVFWEQHFPNLNMYSCIGNWADGMGSVGHQAKLHMFASNFDAAIEVMNSNIDEVSSDISMSILYAKTKFLVGEYVEADMVYDYIINKFGMPTSICYNYLYFCMHTGKYDRMEEILARYDHMNFTNKDFFKSCVRMYKRDIGGAFPSLCDSFVHAEQRRLLGMKCVRSLEEVAPGENLLVIACSGLGDEIGNAVFYNKISKACRGKVTFTCDSRLCTLFRRSLPNLAIEPVRRLRNLPDIAKAPYNYANLPCSAYIDMFDNHGYGLFERADKVILDMDAIRSVVRGYEDFSGLATLVPDAKETERYRRQLPVDGKLTVGLCWRSVGRRYSRIRNYCRIEDFEPLFKRDDIRIVILQYDGCSPHEEAWIREHYPHNTMSFAGLDMYDDLDGLAAAIAALDMVISPAVNIRQVSGSLGVPTSFLVSSSSIDWRKEEDGEMDVIYKKTIHRRIEDVDAMCALLQQDIDAMVEKKARACAAGQTFHCAETPPHDGAEDTPSGVPGDLAAKPDFSSQVPRKKMRKLSPMRRLSTAHGEKGREKRVSG